MLVSASRLHTYGPRPHREKTVFRFPNHNPRRSRRRGNEPVSMTRKLLKNPRSRPFRAAAADEGSRKCPVFRARFLAEFTPSPFAALRTVRSGANGLERVRRQDVFQQPAAGAEERRPIYCDCAQIDLMVREDI